MATGARRRLAFIAESVWNTAPPTAAMKIIRTTGGGGIESSRTSLESAELRSDRMISDFRLGNQSTSFSLPFELSITSGGGDFDPLFESALWGSWSTNVLEQGSTMKHFTIEEAFLDMTTPYYRQMTGAVVNNLSLNIQPNALVTGTMDFIGGKVTPFSTSPFYSGSYTAASTDPILDSFTGTLTEGGVSPGVIAYVTGVNFTISNNIEEQFAILSADAKYPYRFGAGRSRITGTLSAYFQDVTLYNKFVNETSSSLAVKVSNGGTGAAEMSYTFTFPKIKYTGATKNLSETNIAIDMPFIALYDSGTETQMYITRDVAIV